MTRRQGSKQKDDAGRAVQIALQQLQQLRREASLARRILQGEPEGSASGSLAHDLQRWDAVMDEIREAMVEMTSQHDRLQIAHDKLKERLDVHSLRPREVGASARYSSPPMSSRAPSSAQRLSSAIPSSRPSMLPSSQSQDFSAIDAELSKLNESMMREMSE